MWHTGGKKGSKVPRLARKEATRLGGHSMELALLLCLLITP
jgi:hypothetical protein